MYVTYFEIVGGKPIIWERSNDKANGVKCQ